MNPWVVIFGYLGLEEMFGEKQEQRVPEPRDINVSRMKAQWMCQTLLRDHVKGTES